MPPWRLCTFILSLGWALTFSCLTANAAAGNLAIASLVPDTPALHSITLALATFVNGLMNLALPYFFRTCGRWRAYVLGTVIGLAGSGMCFLGLVLRRVPLLLVGAMMLGCGFTFATNYRFGVLLLGVPKQQAPIAISWVLAGGVFGAILGPEYAKHLKSALPEFPFAGVYLGTSAAFALHLLLLVAGMKVLRFEESVSASAVGAPTESVRALRTVFAQPSCWGATAIASVAYSVMVFLMSALPLSMMGGGAGSVQSFTFAQTSTVVQLHMLGMFLPSFFTGNVIKALGCPMVMHIGAVLFGVAGTVMYSSHYYAGYLIGQGILGVGWNFCFIAASAALSKSLMPGAEATRVQAINDLCVFCSSGVLSLLAAQSLGGIGWGGMQVVTMATAVLLVLIAFVSNRRTASEPAATKAAMRAAEGAASTSNTIETSAV